MTCRTNEMHPLDLLYKACRAYPGGIEAMAVRLGVKTQVLYSKLRQQVDSHHVHFDSELSEMLFYLKDAHVSGWEDVLHAFCWRHGHVAVRIPDAAMDDDTMMGAICISVKEHGEAIACIGHGLLDDTITQHEMASIEREIEGAMSALAALQQLVRERHGQVIE